jgi:hypothetical protein
MPEAKTSAASAPSSAASLASTAVVLGFSYREYRYPLLRPSLYASTSAADANRKVAVW